MNELSKVISCVLHTNKNTRRIKYHDQAHINSVYVYIDAWNNLDSTEDWDNEEYTGSLADTKVFTPSTSILEAAPALDEPKPQEVPSTQSGQNVNLSLLQQEVRFHQVQRNILRIYTVYKVSVVKHYGHCIFVDQVILSKKVFYQLNDEVFIHGHFL